MRTRNQSKSDKEGTFYTERPFFFSILCLFGVLACFVSKTAGDSSAHPNSGPKSQDGQGKLPPLYFWVLIRLRNWTGFWFFPPFFLQVRLLKSQRRQLGSCLIGRTLGEDGNSAGPLMMLRWVDWSTSIKVNSSKLYVSFFEVLAFVWNSSVIVTVERLFYSA